MRGENVIHTSVFRSLKGKPTKRAFVLHRFRYETLENSNRNLTRKKQLVGVRVRWNNGIGTRKRKRSLLSLSRNAIFWKRRKGAQSYDRFRRGSDGIASPSPNSRFKGETTRFGNKKLWGPLRKATPAHVAQYDIHYEVPPLPDFENISTTFLIFTW